MPASPRPHVSSQTPKGQCSEGPEEVSTHMKEGREHIHMPSTAWIHAAVRRQLQGGSQMWFEIIEV